VTLPRPHQKPLEPWALELLRQDPIGDPHAEREIAQLIALLRALPEPERSPDLARRILDHVARHESRNRVVHAWFGATRHLTRPAVATLLAAGIAALIALVQSPESVTSIYGTEPRTGGNGAIGPLAVAGSTAPERRRQVVLIRPQFVSAFPQMPAAAPRFRPDRAPLDDAIEARLDRQLNELMIDPTAFAQRLEQVAQRDEFIARLAQRAAERGDAPEIALRVRQSAHPLATQIVDRMLSPTLAASIAPR
jgi:hypothetical protein